MPINTSLRSIFTRSTLKASLKFALIAAVGLATITSLAGLTPTTISMEQIIARAPDKAIPFTQVRSPTRDEYNTDFESAFSDFKESCPTISKEDALSFLTNITQDEYLKAPIQFREEAYVLVTEIKQAKDKTTAADATTDATAINDTTDESNAKKLALMHIEKTLPDSAMLTDYLQRKRIEIAETLQRDPEIIKAITTWNRISDAEYKTAILQRVSRITLNALLPDKVIEYPKVVWILEKKQNPNESTNKPVSPYALSNYDMAFYRSSINEIHINGRLNPIRFQFQTAVDLVTHESIHAFQDILINWGRTGFLSEAPDVDRHVAIMYANRIDDAGAIRFKISDEDTKTEIIDPIAYIGYRLMKTEKMAWGFARIGDTLLKPSTTRSVLSDLNHDMMHNFNVTNPNDSRRHTPLVDINPIEHENISHGTIPKLCR